MGVKRRGRMGAEDCRRGTLVRVRMEGKKVVVLEAWCWRPGAVDLRGAGGSWD